VVKQVFYRCARTRGGVFTGVEGMRCMAVPRKLYQIKQIKINPSGQICQFL